MSTNESAVSQTAPVVPAMQRRWGWLLLLGVVELVCGAFALMVPVAASLAAVIVLGAVLVVSAVFQCIHAFTLRRSRGVIPQALGAILYLVAGILVFLHPVTGVLALTIIVGALLIVDGFVRCTLALSLEPRDGWGWFLAAGIASTAVGVLLLLGWPLTGLWAIGLLLGINLLFSGLINSGLAIRFRSRRSSWGTDFWNDAQRPA